MKIHKEMLARWKKFCDLRSRELGYRLETVDTPRLAWNIAHQLEIPKEAYHVDDSINDAHIETALKRIFPNAWRTKGERRGDI
jgi:hypothetical protein